MFMVKYFVLIAKLFWAILILTSFVSKYLLQTECSKSMITPLPSNGMLKVAAAQLMMFHKGWIPR